MKNEIVSLAITVLLGAVTVGAQEVGNPAEAPAQAPSTNSALTGQKAISALNKATSFIGASVMNDKGKQIGKVRDLVFDLERAELGYVVLALGNETSRDVPVPVRSLKISEGGNHLVLNMSESVLAAAESVTEGAWPPADVFAVGGPAEAESGSGTSSQKSGENE